MPAEPAGDELVMQKVRDGDIAQLSVLFERHSRPLLRYFAHLTGNASVSEDLVQEVFFRMLKYRQSFQPGTSFRAWVYQIARNVHIDHAGRHRLETVMPESTEFRSAAKLQDESLRLKQDALLLRKALAALPVEKREVLVMSRYQGLKYEEIAGILKIETGTVKVRVYRALRDLGDRFFAMRGERAS